ncbi:FMN-binding protein [Maribacter sp. MAR_2009_72]|uniref:FMN-binding protein n=1 Tax=Maribacter sp. MAR_2009_72 TaxID=1250050 RepID=UPI00119B3708|nr:FMN-binding protein [Maribacter sp. MAR_2009_72]TVZ17186.1 FMN-binding protein [Maribacter sp. MAR_2009_72]
MGNSLGKFAIWMLPLFLMGFGLPKNIEKKVDKEIKDYFEIEIFEMKPALLDSGKHLELPSKINENNFFRLFDEQTPIGYVYIDQAPSKTAKFDYLVLLDNNLKIVRSKVLIYREEYGGEIGSKRWLRQFEGKMAGNRVDHESNIDGIAGATISVRSMTNAIDELLQSLAILKENEVL